MRMWTTTAMLLALAACGGGDREVDTPPDVSIETPDGKVQVRTSSSAAANLPEGIPAYPGAEPLASIGVQGDRAGQQGTIVGLRTRDTPAQVINFYADAALRARFAVTSQATMGDAGMLTAERDGLSLHVSASPTGEGTQIQIIAGRSE